MAIKYMKPFTLKVVMLVVLLIAGVVFIPSSTKAATIFSVPTNVLGMAAHWTFDGPDMVTNVRDRSGNGNHGYLLGTSATTTVPGKLGQAISFDGVNDYVNLGTAASAALNGSFTVSFWYTHPTSGFEKNIFGQRSTGTNSRIVVLNENNGLNIRTADENTNWINTWNAPAGWDGKTHHFVWTYDSGSGESIIYADGASRNTATYTFGGSFAGQTWLSHPSLNPYAGMMDDVRIYTRVISPAQVAKLYRDGTGSKTSVSSSVPAAGGGLIGHWTFDGPDMLQNVRDKGSEGNNGFLLGQSSTSTVPGKVGQALFFDGSDDSVNLGSSLNPGAFTLSAWVKASSFANSYNGVIAKNNASGYTILDIKSNGKLGLFLTNGSQQDISYDGTGAHTLSLGKWYHLTMTYDSVDGLKGYVNAVLDGSDDANGAASAGADFYIGRDQSNGHFHGTIDDVRMYNRALSTAEIRALYGSKITIRATALEEPATPGWYDNGDPGTANDLINSGDAGYNFTQTGLILPAGTVSKLRLYMASASFSQGVKFDLYDPSGNLVVSGGAASNGTGSNFWQEYDVTPTAISGGSYFFSVRVLGNVWDYATINGQSSGTSYQDFSGCGYLAATCDPRPDVENPLTEKMFVGAYVTP